MNLLFHQAKSPASIALISPAVHLVSEPLTANKIPIIQSHILPQDIQSDVLSKIIFINNHQRQGTHWNTFCLDLKRKEVTLYCSLSYSFPKEDLPRFLKYFATAYPQYQYLIGTHFKELLGRCPQQNDTRSCGMYALLAAKYLLLGQGLDANSYGDTDATSIRSMILGCYRRLITKGIHMEVFHN